MSPWESFFSTRSSRSRSPINIQELFHRAVWKASSPAGGTLCECRHLTLLSAIPARFYARPASGRLTEDESREGKLLLRIRKGLAGQNPEREICELPFRSDSE